MRIIRPAGASAALGLAVLGGVLWAPLAAPAAQAETTFCLIIDRTAHTSHASLQDAVNAAAAGDTLWVRGTCTGTTEISKDLTITGLRAATLDGNQGGTVLTITSGATVTINRLTITGGYANTSVRPGGGIYNDGTLTVRDSIIRGNNGAGGEGAGVYNARQLTITGTVITDNTSSFGAGIGNYGALAVSNSVISNNSTEGNGGGLDNVAGTATVSRTLFSGNKADGGGGAIDNYEATLTVDNSVIVHNRAGGGGGIYGWPNSSETVSLKGDVIAGNAPNDCAGQVSCLRSARRRPGEPSAPSGAGGSERGRA
jgi:hypothetical protein